MNFKRLSSLFCLSSLVCCNVSASNPATYKDICDIAKENLLPIINNLLCKKQNVNNCMVRRSQAAIDLLRNKRFSDFYKSFDKICEQVKGNKCLDCLTTSTYFSKLLSEKGIFNGVLFISDRINNKGGFSRHAFVIYAYKDEKGNFSLRFADPYEFVSVGLIKYLYNDSNYNEKLKTILEKSGLKLGSSKLENGLYTDFLSMPLFTVMNSKSIDSCDNFVLSTKKDSPNAIPLWNWLSEATKDADIGPDIRKYINLCTKLCGNNNKFKSLVKKSNGEWELNSKIFDGNRFLTMRKFSESEVKSLDLSKLNISNLRKYEEK